MKTSILMSTYNGEKFIEAQMNSIRQQSRTPDEVIFVDDKSSDKTPEIINEYIKKHHLELSWFLYVNEFNKGWRRNFMESVPLTHGDIIFFADQDDFWLREKIEIYCKIFSNDTSVDVLISPYIKWYGEDISLPSMESTYHKLWLNGKYKNYEIVGEGCTLACRRTFYDLVKDYCVYGWAHDDFLKKMSLIEGKLGVLDNASILRRFHNENASLVKRTFESSYDIIGHYSQRIDSIKKYIQDIGGLESHKKDLTLLDKVRRGYENRFAYFRTGNIKYLIKTVIFNPEQFSRLRQIPGDFLLVTRHQKLTR